MQKIVIMPLVVLLGILVFWITKEQWAERHSETDDIVVLHKNNKTATVPQEFDLSTLNEEELTELTSMLNNSPEEMRQQYQVEMDFGRSLLTKGYETTPGVFIFSKLTPVKDVLKNGQPVVKVYIETTEVTLNEGSRQVSKWHLNLRGVGSHQLTTGRENMVYKVEFILDPESITEKGIRAEMVEQSFLPDSNGVVIMEGD